jgi:hypothetical protein
MHLFTNSTQQKCIIPTFMHVYKKYWNFFNKEMSFLYICIWKTNFLRSLHFEQQHIQWWSISKDLGCLSSISDGCGCEDGCTELPPTAICIYTFQFLTCFCGIVHLHIAVIPMWLLVHMHAEYACFILTILLWKLIYEVFFHVFQIKLFFKIWINVFQIIFLTLFSELYFGDFDLSRF